MSADACGETPQEKCRSGLYAAIRGKISWSKFAATITAVIAIGGALLAIVYGIASAASASCADLGTKQAILAKDAEYSRAALADLKAGQEQMMALLLRMEREKR